MEAPRFKSPMHQMEAQHKIFPDQYPQMPKFIPGQQGPPDQQTLVPQQQPDPQQMALVPQQQNPFEMEQYRNIGVPDIPIQYGGGITESMLNNDEIPDKIKEENWWVFNKDNVLSFLDKDRKQSKLLNFDIARIDHLNTMQYYDYNFKVELKWGLLRHIFETKLDRALGVQGGNIKNERILIQSQLTENRQINDQEGAVKEGFFKRLLGRR